jgi:5,10-methylenetetrahydromethanopterin reductase
MIARAGSQLRFGVRIPATRPIREVVSTVRRAESAGLDAACFPDSHLNYRELWATLGAVAVSTERISLGATVTNLVTRHPTVTASAARAIAEVAPSRFVLGVGAGDSAIGFDTLRATGTRAMAEGVRAVRTLLSGRTVRYGEFEAELRGADVEVPIYVAASGPRMLRTAGAVADGVIVSMGSLEEKFARIGEGAEDAGRTRPPVFVYTTCVVTDDVAAASKLMKPFCLRIAQLEGVEIFERAGVRVEPPSHTVGAEGDVGHAADLAAASSAVDSLVSDEAALWFAHNRALVGPAGELTPRFEELAALGAAGVTMSQLSGSDLPDALIDSVAPIIADWRHNS